MTVKFLHGGGNGVASHVFNIDKAQVNTIVAAGTGVTVATGGITA